MPQIPKDLLALLEGREVLCGFSGGADSTALLLLLKSHASKGRFALKAVHFEHGIRGDESRADAVFCESFCKSHGVAFQRIDLAVPGNARPGEGLEAAAIADAARRLNELRENWLNPPEWVQRVPEVVPGYPDRWLPVDEKAAALLKKRTLTHLYNERPAWLANAHRDLDAAVAAAYGWPADLSDDEVLRCLLALNQERALENS